MEEAGVSRVGAGLKRVKTRYHRYRGFTSPTKEVIPSERVVRKEGRTWCLCEKCVVYGVYGTLLPINGRCLSINGRCLPINGRCMVVYRCL